MPAGVRNVLPIEEGPSGTGGNTCFAAGAYRTVVGGLSDALPLVCNAMPEEAENIGLGARTEENFLAGVNRTTDGRTDPVVAETLARDSREVVGWPKSIGRAVHAVVRSPGARGRRPPEALGRHGREIPARNGGRMVVAAERYAQVLSVEDGGKGLIRDHRAAASTAGALPHHLAKAVGSRSGCHSTACDAAAPKACRDPVLADAHAESGYPLGTMVNTEGRCFVDHVREILKQPDGVAWHVGRQNRRLAPERGAHTRTTSRRRRSSRRHTLAGMATGASLLFSSLLFSSLRSTALTTMT